MKKLLALCIMILLALALLAPGTAKSPVQQPTIVTPISGTTYQPVQPNSCDPAAILYTSLPAKCMTADGLQVAAEPSTDLIPVQKP